MTRRWVHDPCPTSVTKLRDRDGVIWARDVDRSGFADRWSCEWSRQRGVTPTHTTFDNVRRLFGPLYEVEVAPTEGDASLAEAEKLRAQVEQLTERVASLRVCLKVTGSFLRFTREGLQAVRLRHDICPALADHEELVRKWLADDLKRVGSSDV